MAPVTPVAQQFEALTQVTPVSAWDGVAGSGLGTVDQDDPSQWSARVPDGLPAASMVEPTAQQSEEPAHVTALRYCASASSVAGVGTMDQAEPSQCSTRAALSDTLGKAPGMKPYWT